MAQKRQKSLTGGAEERFKALLDKRDELNKSAHSLRDERDILHEEKTKYIVELNKYRDQRAQIIGKRKEHIKLRNRYQAKAKSMITERKKVRSQIFPDLPSEVRSLKKQINDLEMRQQTIPMSLPDERELLDEIKVKRKEMLALEAQLTEQSKFSQDMEGLDGDIDTLFKKADIEHAEVIRLSREVDKMSDHMNALRDDINTLGNKANEVHEDFLKTRERANACHAKANEMREKIISMKKEAGGDKREERALLKELNKDVRDTFDTQKVDEKRDAAFQDLKKTGRVELR